MNFQEKLVKIKERVEGNMPPKYLEIMHDATRALEDSGIQDRVLKPGEPMPAFELSNQSNVSVSSTELLEKGPLVLTFYRGFWCPYCNADLENLKKYVEEIESLGATLIALSPEKPKYSKKIINMRHLNFDILSDSQNTIAAAFGLRFEMPADLIELYHKKFNINLKLYHGDNDWTLPMPARFVIEPSGLIRYAESTPDYRLRPDPDKMMDVLRRVVG